MSKNMLMSTDGSGLANKAVHHGIALAKAIGTKITVGTVILPFHVFTLDPRLSKTSDQYHAIPSVSSMNTSVAPSMGLPAA